MPAVDGSMAGGEMLGGAALVVLKKAEQNCPPHFFCSTWADP
jgi:hypothetical protein